MRRHMALVGVLVGALILPFGAGAVASTSEEESTSGVGIPDRSAAAEAAFRDVTRCLNSGQSPSLDVLYLVDLSDSIDKYGLGGILQTVLSTSVQQLDRFRDRGTEVAYSLVAFGFDHETLIPWTAIDGSDQTDAVEGALSNASVDGRGTNYLAGLEAAQEQLEMRSGSCRMLIWMTDGAVNMGGAFDSVFPSLERICRPGISRDGLGPAGGGFGIMQELRDSGIPTFGVFFTNDQLREGLLDFERWKIDFLRPIVEGRGVVAPLDSETEGELSGFTLECAEVDDEGVAPSGSANGALIESEDPVALAFDFLRLEAGLSGGTGAPTAEDGSFEVPAGTAYFRVILPSDQWSLTDPNGEAVPVKPSSITQAGGATSIEVEVDESGWGEWTVSSEGNAIVYLFTGLALVLDRDLNDSILSETENTLSGRVVAESGREIVVNDDLVRHFSDWGTVDVEVVAGGLQSQPSGSLSSTGVFEVSGLTPEDSAPIELRVSLALGGEFDPIESTFQLRVVDGGAFALPASKSLELTTLEGPDGAATGVLQILPPDAAESAQVCVASPQRLDDLPSARNDPVRPRGSFTWAIDSDAEIDGDGCFTVHRDEPVQLSISIGNPEQLNSRVVGAFTVESRTADGTSEHIEPVLLGFDSRTQQNPWIVAAAIILMLILGLGLPMFALWLWNRASTKFAPVEAVTRVAYPVRIERAGRLAVLDRRHDSDGQRITVRPNDFSYVASQPTSAVFDSGRGQMRARVPWFPLSKSWFEWVAPPGHRVVSVVAGSTKQTREVESFLATEVSADIARAWAIIVSDSALLSEDSSIDGDLVVFSGMHSDVRQYQRRVDDVIATPGLIDALTAAAESARADRQVGSTGAVSFEPVSVGVAVPSSMPDRSGRSMHQPGAPTPPGARSFDPVQSEPAVGSNTPSEPGPLAPPRPPSGPLAPPPPPQ